jgi:predicted lipid-binding transport protein (Tim44 family)
MEDFLDIPVLIAIGVIIFVLYRFRSVLGTRTGNERPPVERRDNSKPAAKPGDETVVQMRPRPSPAPDDDVERRARKLETEIEQLSHGDASVASGLRAIAEADGSFGPRSFVEGAKSAYEMIVTAFAQGDRATLKSLLEKEVYDGFEKAIRDREASGHTVDFTFVGLPKVEITDAELDKRSALVTIHFDAEVVQATRDKDGALIEGNADQVQTISDEWTFARSPRSRDPNWKLVATNQLA